ncbi:cytochrome b/b6 domain-containing protein [Oceanicoccus sp. KOV_DT_Chl]|uniref:cytochrome b/b6 domain-containing protein n=1 Tax=Oceanicoccus sp. KOV_DT_Chl TaxID=1904639 RepID=UPI000C7B4F07|nr:cytochrome b/b6 domain-containing protein [Oceanicoccus sp. KOV_DT_Chl]
MTTSSILVWDIHTRLFHWALVLAVTLSLTTGLIAEPDWMPIHFYSGYVVIGLLIFRLLTGIFGQDYGHFKHFHLSIKSVAAYWRSKQNFTGHNPPGSWMVVFMLVILSAQALSGLMTTDDIFYEGPWVYWVDDSWVSIASSIHAGNFRMILLLIAMHILAIAFYHFWRKKI